MLRARAFNVVGDRSVCKRLLMSRTQNRKAKVDCAELIAVGLKAGPEQGTDFPGEDFRVSNIAGG